MITKTRLMFIALVGLTFSGSMWANDDKGNECTRLQVQIGNASSSACQLMASKVVHGKLISAPPSIIPPGFSDRFDLSQTYRGPEVILDYRCNGRKITFSSQQNYCFWKAGDVNGAILEKDHGVSATFTTENGSYYWSKPGLINWVIKD